MSPGRLLPFGLIIWLLIQVTVADDSASGQDKDYWKLNNAEGQTPCQMKDTLEDCSVSRLARGYAPFTPHAVRSEILSTRATPNATRCTCTNVYFNLWSACLLSSGEGNYLYSSSNWTGACKQQGLGLTTIPFSNSSPTTRNVPSWAFMNLSTNQTFDIAQALDAAQQDSDSSSTSKWTAVQIVAPVIAGVGVAMAVALYLYIRRSKRRQDRRRFGATLRHIFGPCCGTRKVRASDRDRTWVIDQQEAELNLGESDSQISSRSPYGHVRLSSSSSGPPLDYSDQKPKETTWAFPAKNLWKNSQLIQKARRTIILLPMPWKNSPISVTSINPSRKFEIDASSKSTRTNSTLANWRKAGFRYTSTSSATTESGPGTSRWDYEPQDTIYEDNEDDDDFDSGIGIGGANTHSDDEHESLIPPHGPTLPSLTDDVLVISNSGRDFSVESTAGSPVTSRNHVEVEPPTPAAEVRPTTPVPVNKVQSAHPPRSGSQSSRLPPAPNYPAPVPPMTPPRSPPRLNQSLHKPSIEDMLLSNATPSRSAINVSSASSPPSTHYVPLPRIPSPPTIPPPPPLPTRRLSNDAFLPSPPQTTPRSHAASLRPLPSMDSVVDPQRPTVPSRPPRDYYGHTRNDSNMTSSLSLPSISSPPYRSSPLPDEIRIARSPSPPPNPNAARMGSPPFNYYRELELPPSSSRGRTPSPLPQPPIHQTQQHRRVFSDDAYAPHNVNHALTPGDAGNHALLFDGYATQQYHHTRDRSMPEERSARTDAAMLFPGAVRAAGYMSPPPGAPRPLERFGPEDVA